ncbi:MAG TPA: hypothetical protein VH814_18020 [Steroidobacteraceae bacterium]
MRLPLFTVLLAVANVALACVVVVQLFGTTRLADEVKAAAQRAHPATVPDVPTVVTPASFEGLQTQAVFHKSRSFYVAPAAPAVEQPPPDYRMVGLMALPNRPPSAVLLNNQSNARVRVATGDQLDGWNVADVNARRVVVQLGERTAEITSTSRAPNSGGVVITPGSQASMTASPGMVRVLGTTPAVQSPASVPARTTPSVDAAPRLYRPPSQ